MACTDWVDDAPHCTHELPGVMCAAGERPSKEPPPSDHPAHSTAHAAAAPRVLCLLAYLDIVHCSVYIDRNSGLISASI